MEICACLLTHPYRSTGSQINRYNKNEYVKIKEQESMIKSYSYGKGLNQKKKRSLIGFHKPHIRERKNAYGIKQKSPKDRLPSVSRRSDF